MKTLAFALTLATLATFTTACDPASTGTPSDESTFRDDVFIPPTTGGGTILLGKGGHDLPTEILLNGYDRADYEIQWQFYASLEKQVIEALQTDFLNVEQNYEECPYICDELGGSWDEGVYVGELRYEIGAVSLAESAEGLHWQTEVRGEAQVGCGCNFY